MKAYERAAEICSKYNADALLLTSEENCRYVTGFGPSEGMTVVTAAGECMLLTDYRYVEAASKKTEETGVKVIPVTASFFEALNGIFDEKSIKTVGYEDKKTAVYMLGCMKERLAVTFTGIANEIENLRNIKTSEEIASMISAQRIAENALENTKNYIKAGVSERALAARLDYEMRILGSEGVSFDTIFISGENTSMPHGVPSDRLLAEGDFITVDFGAVYGGYHSDMTRTYALGYASDEMKKVYDCVLRAQSAGIAAVEIGTPCSEPYRAAMKVLESEGYGKYFTHSLGHGVGLEIHEGYSLSPRSRDTLQKGNVITVEPGVYIPGKFGVRIEDVIYLGEKKTNLMMTDKELEIL